MRLAVVGGRDFKDKERLYRTLSNYKIDEIVSGGASGADCMAARFARERGIRLTIFSPDWNSYGRAAGPIRNRLIVENCDCVIAFWDGVSRGTKSTLEIAEELGVSVYVYNY